MVQKYQMTTEFIEVRRRALSVYLNKVVSACYYILLLRYKSSVRRRLPCHLRAALSSELVTKQP